MLSSPRLITRIICPAKIGGKQFHHPGFSPPGAAPGVDCAAGRGQASGSAIVHEAIRTRPNEDAASFASRLFFTLLLAISGLLPRAAAAADQPAETKPPLWKDPAQPLELRVRDLVGRMTLEEKALQVCNEAPAIPRLGLPAYNYWNECLHGIGRNGIATVFPAGHRHGGQF